MRFPRSGGVLVHPTSFPGPYGIGDLGDSAYGFIDFLARSRQSIWQVLPLGPTGYADSPYQSFSAFAGNPLLISPDKLVEENYLPSGALAAVPAFPAGEVDFGPVIDFKNGLLKTAFEHFRLASSADQRKAYESFSEANMDWLEDFALYMALKHLHIEKDGGVWNTWPKPIARRDPAAVREWSHTLADEVALHKFTQFLFFEQWLALKSYANGLGHTGCRRRAHLRGLR